MVKVIKNNTKKNRKRKCRHPESQDVCIRKIELEYAPREFGLFFTHPCRDVQPCLNEKDTDSADASKKVRRFNWNMNLACWQGKSYPTRICLGKNPTTDPNFSIPRSKNVNPVKKEDRANATIVVAITCFEFSSSI